MADGGSTGGKRVAVPMGVMVVDKPAGITSHDVVDRLRRALGIRKIGHTGSLDPMATGVLVACIGDATRYSRIITSGRKAYEAGIMLGVTTDTDDAEGEVVKRYQGDVGEETGSGGIIEFFENLCGEQEQMPPVFSAKKIGGKPAYAIARKGGNPELERVKVEIFEARPLRIDPPVVDVFLEVSSGTYIRSIARDLGEKLGCGAHLIGLRRTFASGFGIERAVALETLEKAAAKSRIGAIDNYLLPVDQALKMLRSISLDDEDLLKIRNGRRVIIEKIALENGEGRELKGADDKVRIYGNRRGFEGLGMLETVNGDLELRPLRLIPA